MNPFAKLNKEEQEVAEILLEVIFDNSKFKKEIICEAILKSYTYNKNTNDNENREAHICGICYAIEVEKINGTLIDIFERTADLFAQYRSYKFLEPDYEKVFLESEKLGYWFLKGFIEQMVIDLELNEPQSTFIPNSNDGSYTTYDFDSAIKVEDCISLGLSLKIAINPFEYLENNFLQAKAIKETYKRWNELKCPASFLIGAFSELAFEKLEVNEQLKSIKKYVQFPDESLFFQGIEFIQKERDHNLAKEENFTLKEIQLDPKLLATLKFPIIDFSFIYDQFKFYSFDYIYNLNEEFQKEQYLQFYQDLIQTFQYLIQKHTILFSNFDDVSKELLDSHLEYPDLTYNERIIYLYVQKLFCFYKIDSLKINQEIIFWKLILEMDEQYVNYEQVINLAFQEAIRKDQRGLEESKIRKNIQ